MMGTAEGDRKNKEYNAIIRMATINYAMIDHLLRPKPGFEECIILHFKLKTNEIKSQVEKWCEEEKDSKGHSNLCQIQNQLNELLDAL